MLRITGFYAILASCTIVFLLMTTGFSYAAPSTLSRGRAQLETYSPRYAPNITFQDENAIIHTYSMERGNKLTAIHFWATWCPPCTRELSEVNHVQKKRGSHDFKILTISMDDFMNRDQVRKYLTERKLHYIPMYYDVKNAAFHKLGGRRLPLTIFLNNEGKEIARANGPMDWESDEVQDFISKQLKQ